MKICLVTEELWGIGIYGGIGTAFRELALALSNHKHQVTIILVPTNRTARDIIEQSQLLFKSYDIDLICLDPSIDSWPYETAPARAYSVFKYLHSLKEQFDCIHFHEYKGIGFYCLSAKRLGIQFNTTELIVQAHGSTEWTSTINGLLHTDPLFLQIDYMEKKSVEWADILISPSQYLLDFMEKSGFTFPLPKNVKVLKNVFDSSQFSSSTFQNGSRVNVKEIIFFGRHENRKGFTLFCKSISRLNDYLSSHNITITFLGRIGEILDKPSSLVLTHFAQNWKMPIKILPFFGREEALQYLISNDEQLVVIASEYENSPYTILEAIAMRKPILASNEGGGPELIRAADRGEVLCKMTINELSSKIRSVVEQGALIPAPEHSTREVVDSWIEFHSGLDQRKKKQLANIRRKQYSTNEYRIPPKVVFGITHYERPDKLLDAVNSALNQTYPNIEIVVVDDCSTSDDSKTALAEVEALLHQRKGTEGKVIRRFQNGYLGAARNTIASATNSKYLVFLDDDDVALPNLVSTLVFAAERSEADVVNCFNLFLDINERASYAAAPEKFIQKVSYLPTGGAPGVGSDNERDGRSDRAN